MSHHPEIPLLDQPVSSLSFSEKFKQQCEEAGFLTPRDLLKLPRLQQLLDHPGFDITLLMEFTHFLSRHHLQEYLMPGHERTP